MNHFKTIGVPLLKKGIVALPARYGSKAALLKGWSRYFDENPSPTDIVEWGNLKEANVDVLLGKCSGIVALDLDTDKPEIMKVIEHLLPDSPVEKRGSKGWTRFYRYVEDASEQLKFNGEVILEILSDAKKTTIPPSLHPNGANYVWTSEKTLLDINIDVLPVLPPSLISTLGLKLRAAFGDSSSDVYGRVITGRNSTLSSKLGELLNGPHTIEQVVKDLLDFDKLNNEPPYFTDPNEHQHTEAYTNALLFYSSHLNSYNSKRMRQNEEYVTPVAQPEVAGVKKPEAQEVSQKSLKAHDSIPAHSVTKTIFDTINANAWVKQPELALAATLSLGAVLASRKFMFQGMTTNTYIVCVSNSGSGKDLGLQFVKKTLIDLKLDNLLGAGDMGSDAGLTDNLTNNPTKIFPMDEIGGILKSMTYGGSEYKSKMADILTELYTCSTSRYLGRVLAEGVKGAIDRPHLSILGATTPTGFREGVSRASLDKGLLGRFLVFFGDENVPSTRVKKTTKLPQDVINQILWLASYRPNDADVVIQGREQLVEEISSDEAADKRLDELFLEFDKIRLANQTEAIAPIAARLYQQMIKIVIISAALNSNRQVPIIRLEDVDFGYGVIMSFFENFKMHIDTLISGSPLELMKSQVLTIVRNSESAVTKSDIILKTKHLTASSRNAILDEMVESGQLDLVKKGSKFAYRYSGDV